MAKTPVSVRLNPETVQILRQIARKEYGKDNKIAYVIEAAANVYYTQLTNPKEASAILSNTEERLIDRFDKRFNEAVKEITNRVGNLQAKTAYETCLSSLILEDIYGKVGANKHEYEKKRKDAAKRMKTRYEKEGADTPQESEKQVQALKDWSNGLVNYLASQSPENAELIKTYTQENPAPEV